MQLHIFVRDSPLIVSLGTCKSTSECTLITTDYSCENNLLLIRICVHTDYLLTLEATRGLSYNWSCIVHILRLFCSVKGLFYSFIDYICIFM